MEYATEDWADGLFKPKVNLSLQNRTKLVVLGEIMKEKLKKSPALRAHGGQKRRALGRFHRAMREGNVDVAVRCCTTLGISETYIDAAFALLQDVDDNGNSPMTSSVPR